MVSIVPTHRPVFADELALYDVFSLYRDGRDEMRVISVPEHHRNLVGDKLYIIVRVNRMDPHAVGEMIFLPTNLVYIRNTRRTIAEGGH